MGKEIFVRELVDGMDSASFWRFTKAVDERIARELKREVKVVRK